MKAIYFLEKDNVKYYKCDTFWSKSKDRQNAKIHNDSEYDQDRFFDAALYSLSRIGNYNEEEKDSIKGFFEGCIYGYQTFDDDQLQSQFSLKEDSEVSEPVYLKMVQNVQEDGTFEVIDYKQILRDEKINKIIQ